MPSLVDPTKPADGIAALKSDLRTNLAIVKAELDHGGFTSYSPSSYTAVSGKIEDHLAGIDEALPDADLGTLLAKEDSGQYAGTPFQVATRGEVRTFTNTDVVHRINVPAGLGANFEWGFLCYSPVEIQCPSTVFIDDVNDRGGANPRIMVAPGYHVIQSRETLNRYHFHGQEINQTLDYSTARLHNFRRRARHRAGNQTLDVTNFTAGETVINGATGTVTYTLPSRIPATHINQIEELTVVNKGTLGVGGEISWQAGPGMILRGDTDPLPFGADATISWFREHDGSAEYVTVWKTR